MSDYHFDHILIEVLMMAISINDQLLMLLLNLMFVIFYLINL
jgi:hypothetical protein